MKHKIKINEGVLKIESPLCEIIPLRHHLLSIVQESIIQELSTAIKEGGNSWGLVNGIAKKYHTSSANVKKIIKGCGLEVKRDLSLQPISNQNNDSHEKE